MNFHCGYCNIEVTDMAHAKVHQRTHDVMISDLREVLDNLRRQQKTAEDNLSKLLSFDVDLSYFVLDNQDYEELA